MGKFTSETARLAGQKSKRGKAKLEPILQDAIEVLFTEGVSILYERRHELNNSQLLKMTQVLANYVVPKAKPQLDRWSQEYRDISWTEKTNKTDFFDDGIHSVGSICFFHQFDFYFAGLFRLKFLNLLGQHIFFFNRSFQDFQ